MAHPYANSPLNHCDSEMMHSGGWKKMRTINSPGTTGNKEAFKNNEKLRSPLNKKKTSCWTGYSNIVNGKTTFKKKGGKMVPDCKPT